MAHQIGYVDNTGSEGLAHWQMLETIRRFATGYGTAAAPTYAGTGNGTMTAVDTYPATVSETWTIKCTTAGITFSVTGSVSGAKANATVGTPYDNDIIKFTLNAGSTAFAVNDAFTLVTTASALPAAQRWVTQRYNAPTDGSPRELILKGAGLSGTEEIYIGFRTYHSVSVDYYNMTAAGFTGYVPGNTFNSQPGYYERGLCAHNQRIDYWLAVNGQRILFALRLGVPAVYETAYAGKLFPYATPGQFPYPVAAAGMLPDAMPATRFSDTSASHWAGLMGTVFNSGTYWVSDNARLRSLNGAWICFRTHPWTNGVNGDGSTIRDTGGYYQLLPSVVMTRAVDQNGGAVNNVVGEFDGVRYVSGFNVLSEYTMTVGGKLYVVIGNSWRTGIGNYMALEMD